VTRSLVQSLSEAVRDGRRVSGLTHGFYRYPARFSPQFARTAIEAFTEPGDLVYDPFMGGGTALVEACALGRNALGTDVNSLSVFVSRAKTTVLNLRDIEELQAWVQLAVEGINLRRPSVCGDNWVERGYQRNIHGRRTWPIRKALEQVMGGLGLLASSHLQRFARCLLLKTAQWALDCRRFVPSVEQFRRQLLAHAEEMIAGATEFATAATERGEGRCRERAKCLHRNATGIEQDQAVRHLPSPRLVVTSPPYPGVHVLYHRWQVQGRRETPAPYWIADVLDGDGASFYTFGDRKQPGLTDYFKSALDAFTSVANLSDSQTIVVQMIAFSDPSWQLPAYLETMERAGLVEVIFKDLSCTADGRLWRRVPNRKFYADQQGATTSSEEVVLFHRRAWP